MNGELTTFRSVDAAADVVWNVLAAAGLEPLGPPKKWRGEHVYPEPLLVDFPPMTRPETERVERVIRDVLQGSECSYSCSWAESQAFDAQGHPSGTVPFRVWIN